ncbi:MAG TPA: YsnF/AvaK domain-containing protein [Noviherbaspirillum sp.]|uniref:YsnF/AvaK domain-containing protein n=1 Tax=Noviherbaspirillum sp. TaxID=1926288 RepID=UPI002D254899|nr:YsnF/AvaK domain-containing protein [Noviherbaspirillum sp.]HYD94794.1 YsnF/AvaK domain-containing protein [Noviherbaspirillum sp.]
MAHISERGDIAASHEGLVGARVVDTGGNEAAVMAVQPDGGDSTAGPQAWIRVQSGAQVLVPVGLLAPQDDGSFRLPFAFTIPSGSQQPTQLTFPVMEEQVHVSKRVIDTGRGVRIHKTVSEREEVLDQPLSRDRLEVEHVAVGRVVSESDVPQLRYEGETLVVPVLEEVLVVQKQLLLREEVRITRYREEVRMPETVMLRSEQVQVERFDEGRERS